MILTAISYVIIQGAAFGAGCDLATDANCKGGTEHYWSLAALLTCILAFAAYMWYNVKHANDEDKEDLIGEVKKQAIESHIISLSTAFEKELTGVPSADTALEDVDGERRFNETLKMFFRKYDKNGDGVIDPYELKFLLKDVGEDMPDDKFVVFVKEIDTDGSGALSFKEFAVAMKQFLSVKTEYLKTSGEVLSISTPTNSSVNTEGEDELPQRKEGEEEAEAEGEEEEDDEVPEDLANLPPKRQKLRILWRSAWMMGLGTGIVLLFSDPMVGVLNTLGDRFNINAFYVAFVLAPVASNASELIASINYATKKTKKTITISLGALEGAACMNNTFCLGIFLCLIYAKKLVWEFSAETIVIIVIELALFGFSLKRTHRLLEACIILSLYPLSIFLVWFLENVAGLN